MVNYDKISFKTPLFINHLSQNVNCQSHNLFILKINHRQTDRDRWGVIIERQSEKIGEYIGQNSVLISILKPMNVLETK